MKKSHTLAIRLAIEDKKLKDRGKILPPSACPGVLFRASVNLWEIPEEFHDRVFGKGSYQEDIKQYDAKYGEGAFNRKKQEYLESISKN